MSKYNESVSVSWSDITSLFRWRLRLLVRDAMRDISCSHSDQEHKLGDEYFIYHEYQAALACQKVFEFVDLYSSLRAFLRYAPLNESVSGVSMLRTWYAERSEEALSYGVVRCPSHAPYFYPEDLLPHTR